jgi:glycosyltransferase involved in cell wall biosynthesis
MSSCVDVSVLVLTYNHEAFIEQAVASVLRQETQFTYEILLMEDCSTDDTRALVQQLAATRPETIRLLLSERNRNDNSLVADGLETARGRYIAFLDGDDEWISPEKLQTQISFLEAHPECAGCVHNALVVYEDRSAAPHLRRARPPRERFLRLVDLMHGMPVPGASIVVRTDVVRPAPAWFTPLWGGDWGLLVLAARHGTIAYLDQVMSLYRIHRGGIWSSGAGRMRELEDVEIVVGDYRLVEAEVEHDWGDVISKTIARHYSRGSVALLKRRRYREAHLCGRRALRNARGAQPLTRLRATIALTGVRLSRLAARFDHGSPARR